MLSVAGPPSSWPASKATTLVLCPASWAPTPLSPAISPDVSNQWNNVVSATNASPVEIPQHAAVAAHHAAKTIQSRRTPPVVVRRPSCSLSRAGATGRRGSWPKRRDIMSCGAALIQPKARGELAKRRRASEFAVFDD
jgi:hypothetical protein